MIKQLDADGTFHLTATKGEVVSLMAVVESALMAGQMGLARFQERDVNLMQDLVTIAYQMPDEEILDLLIEPHLNHEGDDLEKIREMYAPLIEAGREQAQNYGYVAE